MAKGIIQGEGVVAGKEATAEEPKEDPVEKRSATPPNSNDLSGVIDSHLHDYATFHEDDSFDVESAKVYTPFIAFNDVMQLCVHKLSTDEYLGTLRQTSPDLAELIELTDMKDKFPDDGLYIFGSKVFEEATSGCMDLRSEKGNKAIGKFSSDSLSVVMVSNYHVLSLFMEHGEEFRKYCSHLGEAISVDQPLIKISTETNQENENYYKFTFNLKGSRELFSPENLLDYVRVSGSKDISPMLTEYTALIDDINVFSRAKLRVHSGDYVTSDKGIKSEFLKKLHGRLEDSNPQLTTKYWKAQEEV